MVFQSKLWFKALGVLYLLWSLFMLYVLTTSWHIDNETEKFYVFGMFVIFFIAGIVNIIIALKYRLIISDSEITEINAFKKNKVISLNSIDKIIIFKHRSKAKIISSNQVIVIGGTLRYFMTFVRVLSQKVPHYKFVFYYSK